MKGSYNPDWILNELSQIIPIPQHAWDKESATGAVGNYDLTSSGAAKVFAFLSGQNKQLSTYATNPLWQVVDGPWKLSSYNPTSSAATFVPNRKWSGSPKPSISQFKIVTFTSDAAEFNSLLSGGLTYGYVPADDQPQASRVEQQGFAVQPWIQWNINFVSYNFTNPVVGPIFRQLYVRQAMQHLVDQAALIHATMAGYGYPTNGPVPLQPGSKWVSAQEKKGWYSYSPSAARALLSSHGWKSILAGRPRAPGRDKARVSAGQVSPRARQCKSSSFTPAAHSRWPSKLLRCRPPSPQPVSSYSSSPSPSRPSSRSISRARPASHARGR